MSMSMSTAPLPSSIAITAMNAKQGWALSRTRSSAGSGGPEGQQQQEGPRFECKRMRYSPLLLGDRSVGEGDDVDDVNDDEMMEADRRKCAGPSIISTNYPQKNYTGFETCQMCNGTLDTTTPTRQAAYKKKNICHNCRSHKQAFLHLPTRWVFKYCHGCSRFEHIAFFSSPSAGSCEERQSQKALWARQRRSRAKEAAAEAEAVEAA